MFTSLRCSSALICSQKKACSSCLEKKHTPKPSKRAKISGIERFFKDQVEKTCTLGEHASSDSSNNQHSLASMNTIFVDNPSNYLADFVENDEMESPEILYEAISRSPLHNEQLWSVWF